MASRVCTDCGINFPTEDEFRVCPACGEGTMYNRYAYQEVNWRVRAEAIAARLAALVKQKLFEPPHVDATTTVDDEGLEWLSSHDAINAGQNLQLDRVAGSVVSIGPPDDREDCPDNNLYEVICYVSDKRSYWVRRLRVPEFVPE